MTAPPRRREKRRAHLDAATVPVERALLARAADMESASSAFREASARPPLADDAAAVRDLNIRTVVLDATASEFRALAEELHWHG